MSKKLFTAIVFMSGTIPPRKYRNINNIASFVKQHFAPVLITDKVVLSKSQKYSHPYFAYWLIPSAAEQKVNPIRT